MSNLWEEFRAEMERSFASRQAMRSLLNEYAIKDKPKRYFYDIIKEAIGRAEVDIAELTAIRKMGALSKDGWDEAVKENDVSIKILTDMLP